MRKAIKEIVVTKKIKDLNLSLNNLKKYATLQDQQNLCIKESTVKDLILKNNQVNQLQVCRLDSVQWKSKLNSFFIKYIPILSFLSPAGFRYSKSDKF